MRVLLRHRQTKRYVGPKQAWVDKPKAQDYNNVASAVQAAQQHSSHAELEILMSFEDPRYDISLPLRP